MRNQDPAISPVTPPARTSMGEPENGMEILATRMARLEPEAFWEFADEFGPRLIGFFMRRGAPETDAEQLAFECLLVVGRKIGQYRRQEGGSFEGWVFKIARRKLIDWLRKTVATQPIDDIIDSLASGGDPWSELLKAIEEEQESPTETTRAVHEALAQLSTADQEVIRLRFIDTRLDNAELAAHLGIQINAAKTRLSRAIKRLKTILEKDPRIKIRK